MWADGVGAAEGVAKKEAERVAEGSGGGRGLREKMSEAINLISHL